MASKKVKRTSELSKASIKTANALLEFVQARDLDWKPCHCHECPLKTPKNKCSLTGRALNPLKGTELHLPHCRLSDWWLAAMQYGPVTDESLNQARDKFLKKYSGLLEVKDFPARHRKLFERYLDWKED